MRLFKLKLNRASNQRGFTALETMIASAITLTFLAAFLTVFSQIYRQFKTHDVYFDTNRGARFALESISRDVRESIGCVYSYSSYTRGDSTLILKLPSIDAQGVPTNIATQFDYVVYRINPSNSAQVLRTLDVLNGTSQREGGGDQTDTVIYNDTLTLTFSYSGTNLGSVSSTTVPTIKKLSIAVSTRGQTVGTTQSTTVSSDVMLRNRIP